ncbi:MAG TPA: hypothetical protein VNV25_02335 [Gemmatimonadaceae bacterium]|jgi:hypothetical protein|nr:hypothetical protein [Gemmatimonadaceae bacterium]
MLPEQPAGDSRRGRGPSHKPQRRFLHVPFTVQDYETITIWASAAGLSRSCYVREAALAIPILRRVSPRDRLPHTTRAIACVRALAHATMAAVDAKTAYRLEAAIAELDTRAEELEDHAEAIAAQLALLPSPHADPHPDSPWLSSGVF